MTKIHLTFEQVAQTSHVALGAWFVFLPMLYNWPYPQVSGSLIGLAFAAIKEFLVDPATEDIVTQGSALQDFSFWVVGIALANVLMLF